MQAVQFYDGVLWLHIVAVVVGFGGPFSYPVWFGLVRGWDPPQRVLFHRAQSAIGKFLISPGLLVLILTGAYLASDRDYWDQLWVQVPLAIAVVLGAMGGLYFARRDEELAQLAEAGGGPEYDRVFAEARNISYASMFLVLVAAFFMVTKLGA